MFFISLRIQVRILDSLKMSIEIVFTATENFPFISYPKYTLPKVPFPNNSSYKYKCMKKLRYQKHISRLPCAF